MKFSEGDRVRHLPTGREGIVAAIHDTAHGPAVIVRFVTDHTFKSFIDTDRPGFNRISELGAPR